MYLLLSLATNYSLRTAPLHGQVWGRRVPTVSPACPSSLLLAPCQLHLAAIISLGINAELTHRDTWISACHSTHVHVHCSSNLGGIGCSLKANNNNHPSEDCWSLLVQPCLQSTPPGPVSAHEASLRDLL